MDNLKVLTTERLNNLIEETQNTLNELKQEMGRREVAQKEHQIMDLDNHMKSAELSLASIRNFIHYLLEESKKR
jgi:hypothetical protein